MAARLLAILLSALALLGSGYWWGHTATDNAWTARQVKDTAEAANRQFRAWERADEAVATYTQNHQNLEKRYAELDARYQNILRRVPLVRVNPVVVGANGSPVVSAQANPEPQDVPQPVNGSPDVRLTLAAVRVWNGYLTGTDQAAGACGAVDPPEGTEVAEGACDQVSGLTLDDAWENHRLNARDCADDRARYRSLIDYLKTPQGD
jgi:hypothetical protein